MRQRTQQNRQNPHILAGTSKVVNQGWYIIHSMGIMHIMDTSSYAQPMHTNIHTHVLQSTSSTRVCIQCIIRCVEKGEGALAPTDLPSGKSQKAATQLSKSSDVCHQHVAENFVRNSHFFANITSDSSPSRVPHRGHSRFHPGKRNP